jgi:hypothetical protein
LDLAIDDPALHGLGIFFVAHFNDVGNALTPLLFGHPARVRIPAQLPVRIGADQAVFDFHGSSWSVESAAYDKISE